MSAKDFDIRPKAHASPTSRPIIVNNRLRQDPMVKSQAKNTASAPVIKTTKTTQPKIVKNNQSSSVASAEENQVMKPKRTYVYAIIVIALVITAINFLLDAGVVTFSIPLLPFTNLF